MILKFQRSTGVRLWRAGRRQWELWLCPRGEVIPGHTHERMDARIFFLGGGMIFRVWREGGWRERVMGLWSVGKGFLIRAGEVHGAVVTGWFGLFLVSEIWSCEPTSAVVDFRVSA